MADETVVDDMQARILGGLNEAPVAKDTKEVEAVHEVDSSKDEPTEVDKTEVAITKKRDVNKEIFKVTPPVEAAPDDTTDWKAKAAEYEGKVREYETKAEQETRFNEETKIFNEIKEMNGPRWTPAVDKVVSELIDNGGLKDKDGNNILSLYDKLAENKNISAQERMLMITNTALQMVDEPEKKLRTEKVKEVKDLGKLNVADVKGDSVKKRTPAEAMKAWKSSGDDKDLQEAMGVEDVLNQMFNK